MNTHMNTRLLTKSVTLVAALLMSIAPAFADHHEKKDQSVGGVAGPGGSIKGMIAWSSSKTPSPKPLRMNTDPFCAKAHQGKKAPVNERYLFGKNGDKNTLINTFIWVSKGVKDAKTPSKPVMLDQNGCVYTPHVQAVVVKQPLEIRNSDNTLHNVNGTMFKKNPPFNLAQPVKGMVEKRSFENAEMGVLIRCDVHPWMNAFLHVVEHPYYAITGEKGTYEIKGLPAGEYEVSVWHEFSRFAADAATKKVTVKDGAAAELDFAFDVKK